MDDEGFGSADFEVQASIADADTTVGYEAAVLEGTEEALANPEPDIGDAPVEIDGSEGGDTQISTASSDVEVIADGGWHSDGAVDDQGDEYDSDQRLATNDDVEESSGFGRVEVDTVQSAAEDADAQDEIDSVAMEVTVDFEHGGVTEPMHPGEASANGQYGASPGDEYGEESADDLPLISSNEPPASEETGSEIYLDTSGVAGIIAAEPDQLGDSAPQTEVMDSVEETVAYGDSSDLPSFEGDGEQGESEDAPVVIPVSSESDIAAATGTGEGFAEVPRSAEADLALPPPPFGSADPHSRARRLARALVSDIVVYHPDRRERSLRSGTVRQEFREEIRKSWDEYVGHVGNQLARDTPYFREALNELLAGGTEIF